MTSMALHAAPTGRRRGWFARLRDWWTENRELAMAEREREAFDWTEPEPDPEPRLRSSAPPSGGGWPTLPPPQPPQTVHPPFAHRPAQHTHVAIRMQRVLTEASWDPDLTPTKLWNSMRPLVNELVALARQEQDQPRRMERNQHAAVAQTVLLQDAVLRGVPDEAAVEQAKEGIVGRAGHVAQVERTAAMEPITDDTPDPRAADLPQDVNPGDAEAPPEQSPVRDPDEPIPLPTEEFVGGEHGKQDPPKPRRSPRTKRAPAPEPQEAGST